MIVSGHSDVCYTHVLHAQDLPPPGRSRAFSQEAAVQRLIPGLIHRTSVVFDCDVLGREAAVDTHTQWLHERTPGAIPVLHRQFHSPDYRREHLCTSFQRQRLGLQ